MVAFGCHAGSVSIIVLLLDASLLMTGCVGANGCTGNRSTGGTNRCTMAATDSCAKSSA
jgi:hypothetical protein